MKLTPLFFFKVNLPKYISPFVTNNSSVICDLCVGADAHIRPGGLQLTQRDDVGIVPYEADLKECEYI